MAPIRVLDLLSKISKNRGMFENYDSGEFYCEMTGGANWPAEHTAPLRARLNGMKISDLRRRAKGAAAELFNLGITFTVYSNELCPKVGDRDFRRRFWLA